MQSRFHANLEPLNRAAVYQAHLVPQPHVECIAHRLTQHSARITTRKSHEMFSEPSSSTDLEPVDGAAVDQARVLPQSVPERVAHRAHAEHDVQLLLTLGGEERPQLGRGFEGFAHLGRDRAHGFDHLGLLVVRKHVGHLGFRTGFGV